MHFYNAASKTHDYAVLNYNASTQPTFDSAGWTKNDYFLFMNWYFLDKERYSGTNIEKLFPICTYYKPENWKLLFKFFDVPAVQETLFCWLFFILFCTMTEFRVSLMTGAWTILILQLLALFARLPERIYLPALSSLALISLFFAKPLGGKEPLVLWFLSKDRPWVKFIPLSVLLLWAFSVVQTCRASCSNRSERADTLVAAMRHLNPQKGQLYVCWANGIPFDYLPAFFDYRFFKDFRIFWLCGIQRTPPSLAILEKAGIQNLFRDMVDRKDLFLIIQDPNLGVLYSHYMFEKFNQTISSELYFSCPFFGVFRIHSFPHRGEK